MPISYAVGRRMVLLVSTLVMVVTAAVCASTMDYNGLMAARMVLGLAAGQSEALVPMMTQVCATGLF
jgi:predicted MFS family arabinose efflux permease